MTITISPETEKLVKQQMLDRGYKSPEDLIAAAIEQFAQDQFDIPSDVLNALLDEGQRELDAGHGIPAEKVFAEIEEMSRKRRQERAQ